MKEFFSERPGLVIGLFLVILTIGLVEPWKRFGKSTGDLSFETESQSVGGKAASSRLEQVNRTMYQDPLKAMVLLDQILAQPSDAQERVTAQTVQPAVLELVYYRYLRDRQTAEARKVMERLIAEFPTHRAAGSVRLHWGQFLGQQLSAAIGARDPSAVENAFKQYVAGGYFLPRKTGSGELAPGEMHFLEQYARYQLDRWRALPAETRRNAEGMALAAEGFGPVFEHNTSWRIGNLSQQTPPIYGEELFALATAFEERRLIPQAFNAKIAAQRALYTGVNWQAGEKALADARARQEQLRTNDNEIAKLALALGATLKSQPTNVLTGLTVDGFYDMAANQVQSPEARGRLLEQRFMTATEEYLAFTEPLSGLDVSLAVEIEPSLFENRYGLSTLLHQAVGRGVRIAHDLRRRIFENLLLDRPEALWGFVPPEIQADIERRIPSDTPQDRLEERKRQVLRQLVYDGELPVPGPSSPAFDERRIRVMALKGVQALRSNRDEAFRELRTVLHQGLGHPFKPKVQQAVAKIFRESRKDGKFDALIELAGFYAAEFGESLAADPFRIEFRQALESSAGTFKTGDRMKYVFVQALLASAFANEEIGRKAQQETVTRAFDVVQGVTPDTNFGSAKAPSGVAGWSSVAVDNSTEHHILLVYDGPERFAVLCNPLRKGSFLVQNGKYRIAVLTPLGSIQPYRAERTLQDEHAPADYRIQKSGERDAAAKRAYSAAYGDYTLLRATDGAGVLQVEPRTGMIRKK